MLITVETDGTIRYIYNDEAPDLASDGEADVRVRRASHIEPASDNRSWTADMSPVGGPMLGPFAKRGEALEAETRWLEENHL